MCNIWKKHFRNNCTYFDERLSQIWVPTPIVYGQSACFTQKITLALRSMPTEVSCERSMSTPPAPDYTDAEPSLLPFRQRLSRLFPASHPVQIPQAGLFQDTNNSSAEDESILRPKPIPALRYDKDFTTRTIFIMLQKKHYKKGLSKWYFHESIIETVSL